jgi:hypothetical protein
MRKCRDSKVLTTGYNTFSFLIPYFLFLIPRSLPPSKFLLLFRKALDLDCGLHSVYLASRFDTND